MSWIEADYYILFKIIHKHNQQPFNIPYHESNMANLEGFLVKLQI